MGGSQCRRGNPAASSACVGWRASFFSRFTSKGAVLHWCGASTFQRQSDTKIFPLKRPKNYSIRGNFVVCTAVETRSNMAAQQKVAQPLLSEGSTTPQLR